MFNQVAVNSIIAASIYALVAVGFSVIYGTVRFFHIAHGAVYTVGAYLAYTFMIQLGWHPAVAVALAVGFSALLGVGIDRSVHLPLRQRKASNLIFLLASFGIFIFLQNLIQLIYGAQILTLRRGPVKEGHHILGAVITNIQILIISVSIVVFLIVLVILKWTKKGKAMRAVSDDPITASVVGINPEAVIIFAFALGSALAGLAGMLVSLETNLEPTMGFNALLKGVIAAIVGGIGSIGGAVLGALMLGFAENIAVWYLPAGWKDAIAFAILILFLLFRPQGILGRKEERAG
jgi:branched-chain amino acid transport system permease protein